MDASRGRLRLYLGMAPGVGKTFAMLQEGHRRRARGEDVVVGSVETYGRAATEAVLVGLEVVPRRHVEHRGITVEEMDPEAIRRRAPAIVLIDELAHTNAPGSPNEKRWQDVDRIRDAGIDVISTCNVQHLESIADAVEAMIGAPVRERVPDRVVRGADEIELVDLSPDRLRRRMARGEVYPADRTTTALERFFTEPNLIALRDLALHFLTGRVDAELVDRMSTAAAGAPVPAGRVMAVIDGRDISRRVVGRATLLAERLRAPLVVLIVGRSGAGGPGSDDEVIDDIAAGATRRGAEVLRVLTTDPAGAIAEVALDRSVTHLVLGQARLGRLERLAADPLSERILALAPDLEISLVGRGRSAAEARQATF